MRLVVPPGVFRPISDSWLLADALDRERLPRGARVIDLCSGSGALAVRAALGGAREVTPVDLSRRALATIRLNAALNGARVRARRGARPHLWRSAPAPAAGRRVLLVHSSLLGLEPTAEALRAGGLDVDVAAREHGLLGPLMRARRDAGLIPPVDSEDVLVVRGRKPATIHCRSGRLNVTM